MMKENNYFEELVVSYLLKELNDEEEAFVLEWINSSEENKKYFEEIKNTFRLLSLQQQSEYIRTDLEWIKFKETLPKKGEFSSGKDNERIEQAIEEEKPKKGKVYKFLISAAVAASIIFLILLGWRWSNNTTSTKKSIDRPGKKEMGLNPVLVHHEVNNSENTSLTVLPDGSEVKLFAKSELFFDDPFKGNRRDITLTGKGTFKVAKDKTKPFTVHSGDISISALGTEFTVTAYQDHDSISVRLYEGTIVVKSSMNAKRKLNKHFYLSAGQEFLYNNVTVAGKVRSFKSSNKTALNKFNNKKDVIPTDDPSLPSLGSGWFMFNNEPLGQVFEQLKLLYNVDIMYSKKDVSKIYFIGTFNNSDSLGHVLDRLARINNLKVSKKNNKFIISK